MEYNNISFSAFILRCVTWQCTFSIFVKWLNSMRHCLFDLLYVATWVVIFHLMINLDEISFYFICFIFHNMVKIFPFDDQIQWYTTYFICFVLKDVIHFFIWWSNLMKYLFIWYALSYMISCNFFIWWFNLMKYLFIWLVFCYTIQFIFSFNDQNCWNIFLFDLLHVAW